MTRPVAIEGPWLIIKKPGDDDTPMYCRLPVPVHTYGTLYSTYAEMICLSGKK